MFHPQILRELKSEFQLFRQRASHPVFRLSDVIMSLRNHGWIFYFILLLAANSGAAERSFLFQSVLNVDDFVLTQGPYSKSPVVIFTVPPKCPECLKNATASAARFEELKPEGVRIVILCLTNWEKAQEYLKSPKYKFSDKQKRWLFVDPGGRFMRDLKIERKSVVVLDAAGAVIHQKKFPAELTGAEVREILKIIPGTK